MLSWVYSVFFVFYVLLDGDHQFLDAGVLGNVGCGVGRWGSGASGCYQVNSVRGKRVLPGIGLWGIGGISITGGSIGWVTCPTRGCWERDPGCGLVLYAPFGGRSGAGRRCCDDSYRGSPDIAFWGTPNTTFVVSVGGVWGAICGVTTITRFVVYCCGVFDVLIGHWCGCTYGRYRSVEGRGSAPVWW